MLTQWLRPTPRLLLLKFESNLVCPPCHHGKMIAASHSLVNTIMSEQPGQLLCMDNVGPSRVRSMGGKWYVLVIVEHPNCLKARMKCLNTFRAWL
jgi:hypothetical protein